MAYYQNNPENCPRVSLFTRGYISKMVTQRGAEQYFRSLLQFDDRCLHLSSVYGTIVHFAAQNAQPFTYMPKLNQFVWVLDYKSVGNGAVVPQSIDVQSGRRNELLNMPIFFLQNWGMLGLRLNEAVVGVPKGLLLNGNYAPALVGNCNTISICINWPGYGKWTQSRPISTSRISLDRLAELVAAAVWEFIETAGQQDADHVWRIGGRRGIKSRDIKLIGLIHVRQNIWHPILQLSDDYASSKSNVLWS